MTRKKKLLLILCPIVVFIAALVSLCLFYTSSDAKFNTAVENDGFVSALDEFYPLDKEEFDILVPYDEEKAKKIDEMPSYSDNDTWDIYIYMCGSDLESSFIDTLSDATNMNLYFKNDDEDLYDDILTYSDVQQVLYENGLDFPLSFYDPIVSQEEEDAEYEEDYSKEPGSASEDLRAIATTPLNDNVRFIIQTGGAKKWDFPGINPNRSQRWIIDNKGMREISNNPLVNMGNTDTLIDFLNFTNDYDADHKFFIFWNHGEGSFGAEYDEIFNDSLELYEMTDAFNAVYDLSGEPPFEFIGFDACLMASSEAMHALSGTAKYFIGSEDIEYGGWNYNKWITALCEKPRMNGAQMGKIIVDSFISLATQQYLTYPEEEVPNHLGVYDLAKASLIYDEYAKVIKEALIDSINDPSILSYFTKASSNSIRYSGDDYDNFNTCDLRVFMENVSPLYPSAKNVISLIDEATLYTRGRGHNQYSNSLNVYFPTSIKNPESLMKALKYINTVAHNKDIEAFYYYKAVGALGENYQTYLESNGYERAKPINTSSLSFIKDSEVDFTGEATFNVFIPLNSKQYIASAKLITAIYDEEGRNIKYIGETASCDITDTKITVDIPLMWLNIDNEPLSIEFIDKTEDITRFKSPVLINKSENNIILSYNTSTDEVVISGIKGNDLPSDTMGRSLRILDKNDKITPLYYTESGFYLEPSYSKGKTVRYKGKDSQLHVGRIKDGTYLFCVELTDIRGDVHSSPIVECTIENGLVTEKKVNTFVSTF